LITGAVDSICGGSYFYIDLYTKENLRSHDSNYFMNRKMLGFNVQFVDYTVICNYPEVYFVMELYLIQLFGEGKGISR